LTNSVVDAAWDEAGTEKGRGKALLVVAGAIRIRSCRHRKM